MDMKDLAESLSMPRTSLARPEEPVTLIPVTMENSLADAMRMLITFSRMDDMPKFLTQSWKLQEMLRTADNYVNEVES